MRLTYNTERRILIKVVKVAMSSGGGGGGSSEQDAFGEGTDAKCVEGKGSGDGVYASSAD